MNKTLFTALGASIILFCNGAQAVDVDLTATISQGTCSVEVSNGGIVNLPTVGASYFANGITAETDYAGGSEFTVTLRACDIDNPQALSQLRLEFLPKEGVFAPGSKQIFPNEASAAAANVGIVIFSASNNNMFNVWSEAGVSRAIYPVTIDTLNHVSWPFYTRMQRINALQPVGSGQVRTNVIVDAHYE